MIKHRRIPRRKRINRVLDADWRRKIEESDKKGPFDALVLKTKLPELRLFELLATKGLNPDSGFHVLCCPAVGLFRFKSYLIAPAPEIYVGVAGNGILVFRQFETIVKGWLNVGAYKEKKDAGTIDLSGFLSHLLRMRALAHSERFRRQVGSCLWRVNKKFLDVLEYRRTRVIPPKDVLVPLMCGCGFPIQDVHHD